MVDFKFFGQKLQICITATSAPHVSAVATFLSIFLYHISEEMLICSEICISSDICVQKNGRNLTTRYVRRSSHGFTNRHMSVKLVWNFNKEINIGKKNA